MTHVLLILVALSNLVGSIEIAADFDANTSHHSGQSHQHDGSEQPDDAAHSDHCGHAAGHFLGFASHESGLLLGRASPQFVAPLAHYRSAISRPAVPPNI